MESLQIGVQRVTCVRVVHWNSAHPSSGSWAEAYIRPISPPQLGTPGALPYGQCICADKGIVSADLDDPGALSVINR